MKVEIKEITKPIYKCVLEMNSKEEAELTQKALETMIELRKSGATNIMYCLNWRNKCTSKNDLKAVNKVGEDRLYETYRFFAKYFALDI